MCINAITEKIIGASIEVHNHLGPGLLESTYEACLAKEFQLRSIQFERQKPLQVIYKNYQVEDCSYKLDFFVEGKVILELKALKELAPIHTAQVMTYLKLMNCQIGLLINFNVSYLKNGIERIVNNLNEDE